MDLSKFHEALRLGKRGELFVFSQLLQRGVVPYAPLLDIEAVDCVVRKPGGGFLEIQVKTNNTAKTPLWWNTPEVPESDDYILVLVSVPRAWSAWIFTGRDIYRYCTGRGKPSGMLSIDLAARNRESEVEPFKDNWDIIVQRSQIEPVEKVAVAEDIPSPN